jgi:hypothetical protein
MGCIAPPILAMLALNQEDGPPPSGPITGRVSYNDRPLDQGAIVFAPFEGHPAEWGIGLIGKDGSYSTTPTWRRDHAKKCRYRICVVPLAHTFTREDVSPPPSCEPGRETAAGPPAGGPADVHQERAIDLPIPEKFTKIWTSGLTVTLDRDSARVDLDLRD